MADQVDHPAAEPPLVVVPAHDFGPVTAQRLRQRRIDDRGLWVALEVRRDKRLLAHGEDALQAASGGLVDSGVDVLGGARPRGVYGGVLQRAHELSATER